MDIKALMNKRAQLNNKGNDAILKLAEGDNVLRIVPLAGSPDNPFQELYFHYLGKKTQLSPMTFGEPDPIAQFSDHLISGGNLSKEEFKEAKKFYPVLRTYLPVVVRGKESEGVKFWAFGKTIYSSILDVIADPDYGDISNPETGHDIRVTFTPAEKSPTKFAETKINVKPKPSPLTTDATLLKKLLTEQPVLLDVWPKQTYAALKMFLDSYLNAGTATAPAGQPASSPSDDEWAAPKPRATAEATATVKAGGSAPAPVPSADVEAEFSDIFNS